MEYLHSKVYHFCAVLSGGTVKCWGNGILGRLGNGSTSTQSTPVSVSSISTATSVSAGYRHTCAELSGGTVSCWGYGVNGRLGNGSTSDQTEPVTVVTWIGGILDIGRNKTKQWTKQLATTSNSRYPVLPPQEAIRSWRK